MNTDKEAIKKELKKELVRKDYASYCVHVHSGRWFLGRHLELVCKRIEDLIYRKIPQNILIISMPP